MSRLTTCARLADVLKLLPAGRPRAPPLSPWQSLGQEPGNLDSVSEAFAWSVALPELRVGALPGVLETRCRDRPPGQGPRDSGCSQLSLVMSSGSSRQRARTRRARDSPGTSRPAPALRPDKPCHCGKSETRLLSPRPPLTSACGHVSVCVCLCAHLCAYACVGARVCPMHAHGFCVSLCECPWVASHADDCCFSGAGLSGGGRCGCRCP